MRSLRCGNMSGSTSTHRRWKPTASPITDSLPPSEIPCWRQPTVKRTALCSAHGNRMQTATRCFGEITRRTMNMLRKAMPSSIRPTSPTASAKRSESTTVNARNTMWKTVTLPLSTRLPSAEFRRNSQGAPANAKSAEKPRPSKANTQVNTLWQNCSSAVNASPPTADAHGRQAVKRKSCGDASTALNTPRNTVTTRHP